MGQRKDKAKEKRQRKVGLTKRENVERGWRGRAGEWRSGWVTEEGEEKGSERGSVEE